MRRSILCVRGFRQTRAVDVHEVILRTAEIAFTLYGDNSRRLPTCDLEKNARLYLHRSTGSKNVSEPNSTKLVAGDGVPAAALTDRDWNDFNQNTATDDDLAAIESAVAQYFARHTMQELYDIAVETNLMLAPANSPREIYQSAQLAARNFFGPVGDVARFPRSFVVTRAADHDVARGRAGGRSARSRARRVHGGRMARRRAAHRAGGHGKA